MIFQVLVMDEIRNLFYYLQMAGIVDILIPFVLIFTVLFAAMQKVSIFQQAKEKIMVALAITLLVIIPHITGSIPAEYDVVQIINNSLPSVVLIIFVVLMAMILLGFVVGREIQLKDFSIGIAAIVSLTLIALIFARSAGYFQTGGYSTWLSIFDDPQLGALVIVILMFALITWFITSKEKAAGDRIRDHVMKYIEKFGGQLFGGTK